MSSTDGPGGSDWLGNLRDNLRDVLPDADRSDTTTVIEVRGASPVQRADLVTRLESEHERPVFRLTPGDLVAAPHERAAAALRLLDAAEVAGAIPMLDAVDDLLPDRAAAVALEDRLRTFPGVVVLSNHGPSRLAAVVTKSLHPE
ncbi:MAG TPA: hypothetical protein VJ978_07625 [Nitriliruptoraceae bacterium]|nr:hypothetical protein [Nitriliruptoraceae bacterium]